MVHITVFPVSARDLRVCTTFSAMNESSPDVGSSQNNNAGLVRTYFDNIRNEVNFSCFLSLIPQIKFQTFKKNSDNAISSKINIRIRNRGILF